MGINTKIFQKFIEGAPIGIIIQCAGEIVYINKTLLELFGIKDPDNTDIKKIFSKKGIKEIREIYRNILKKGKDKRILKVQTLTGKTIWIEILTERIDIGGKPCSISSIIDVTDKKELEENLRKQAIFDKLTGIYNRHAFEKFLEEEIRKAERYKTPFALIMFDIDDFKLINDTYGHQIGDIVLKKLVSIIKRTIRKSDIFGRWGGEEFMIIVPVKNIHEAYRIAEKIRKKIENYKFPHVGKITISIGIALYNIGDDVKSIIQRADAALYSAKEAGKNRIAIATAGGNNVYKFRRAKPKRDIQTNDQCHSPTPHSLGLNYK